MIQKSTSYCLEIACSRPPSTPPRVHSQSARPLHPFARGSFSSDRTAAAFIATVWLANRNFAHDFVWHSFWEQIDANTTRFITRSSGVAPDWIFRVTGLAFWEPAHFIMERKMMLGIKERAERWNQRL